MAAERTLDLDDLPDIPAAAAALEAARPGSIVRFQGRPIAAIHPAGSISRHAWRPTPEDIAASLSAAGGWADIVDTEQLLADIREGRDNDRPPIEW